MRRTERAAYRTKFYSNLSSPTRFDEEPKKEDHCRSSFKSCYYALTMFVACKPRWPSSTSKVTA